MTLSFNHHPKFTPVIYLLSLWIIESAKITYLEYAQIDILQYQPTGNDTSLDWFYISCFFKNGFSLLDRLISIHSYQSWNYLKDNMFSFPLFCKSPSDCSIPINAFDKIVYSGFLLQSIEFSKQTTHFPLAIVSIHFFLWIFLYSEWFETPGSRSAPNRASIVSKTWSEMFRFMEPAFLYLSLNLFRVQFATYLSKATIYVMSTIFYFIIIII